MSRLLVRNGRVIDPSQDVDRVTNLLLEDGRVAAWDVDPREDVQIVDATDRIVAPGLIDMHVQLREPGFEEDETIATGAASAVAGGFTTIACLPNTDPPIDTQASVEFIQHQALRADCCRVLVTACVSKQRQGDELAEIGGLVRAGAVAFTDASAPIHNPELMRRALEYSRMFDRPILNRPEVLELSRKGIMHEGLISTILGLYGMPAAAEDVMTSRDIRLAESTRGRLHLMDISTEGSVEIIRRAKSRAVAVTAEVPAINIALNDACLRSFDSNCKLNPPLRSAEEIQACIAGLADGTIDVISSAHAPRAREKKMLDLAEAPFGMSALETVLGTVVTYLIEPGHLSWTQAISKLSTNPARILGEDDLGTLRVGAAADVTVIDPHREWTVYGSRFLSKSSNTPLEGHTLRGIAECVIVGGIVKWQATDSDEGLPAGICPATP